MSVESYYSVTGENLIDKLEEKGILQITYQGFFQRDSMQNRRCARGLIDLQKACPELFEKEIAEIKERGVLCRGALSSPHNNGQLAFLRSEWKLDIPQGYSFVHYDYNKEKGFTGYYIEPEYYEISKTEGRTLITFTEKELEIIRENGKRIDDMWVKQPDNSHFSYRRDYTEKELDNIRYYEVGFYFEKENDIFWIRNYAKAHDENIISYISKALPDDILHIHGSIEGDVLFDTDIKDNEPIEEELEKA